MKKLLEERLEIMADMIQMGDRIAWGTDSEIMREAAHHIRILKEALGFYSKAWKVQVWYSNYPDSRSHDCYEDDGTVAREALAKLTPEEL